MSGHYCAMRQSVWSAPKLSGNKLPLKAGVQLHAANDSLP